MDSRAHNPKYGPPYQEPTGDAPPDPDKGKDLWGLVPEVSVAAPWNGNGGIPSFNDDPPNQQTSSGDGTPTPECWAFQMSMVSMRSGMSTIISELQSAVAAYEDLKSFVGANKDNIFGQNAMVTPMVTGVEGYIPPDDGSDAEPSKIQPQAQEFASHINPAQERALEQMANALEVVGMFVAGVDRAGQSYGEADRKAAFPAPPPNPVHKA